MSISSTQAALAAAADKYRRYIRGDHECPKCGSVDERHEDNGRPATAWDYGLLCTDCGHQWEPNNEDAS